MLICQLTNKKLDKRLKSIRLTNIEIVETQGNNFVDKQTIHCIAVYLVPFIRLLVCKNESIW